MLVPLFIALAFSGDLPVSAKIVAHDGIRYLLNDPEFVAGSVIEASWSPDGTQLLATVVEPRPKPFSPPTAESHLKFVFWSSITRKVIGEYGMPKGRRLDQADWEGPSGSVLVQTTNMDGEATILQRIRPNGSSSLLQTPSPDQGDFRAGTSSAQAGVVMIFYPKHNPGVPGSARLYIFPPNQSTATAFDLPKTAGANLFVESDFFLFDPSANRKGPAFYHVDAATGEVTAKNPPRMAPSPFRVESGSSVSSVDDPKRIATFNSLWLISENEKTYPAALLAPKAQKGDLNLSSQNAFYIDGLNLFVRQLQKVDQDQIDDLLECEERRELLNDVKQVGTGIQIYMADNDDDFPPAKTFHDQVWPYIKNEKILDGFIFSYKGPDNAAKVENPATEVMGYKEGRFGRAVVRVDSSAKWESRRKRPLPIGCYP